MQIIKYILFITDQMKKKKRKRNIPTDQPTKLYSESHKQPKQRQ